MIKLGVITNVTINRNSGKVLVDVTFGPRNQRTDVEYRQPAPGITYIPQEGEVVDVIDLGTNQFMAVRSRAKEANTLPSGASPGDIFIEADANLYLGNPDNATEVADADHTHDFSGTDSGGDSFSGTTSGPSSTTETQIE